MTPTPPSPSRLRGQGLTLGYDDQPVVRDLDIDIVPGSFTALIGPNACGKSTTLRALARLLRPRSGTVLLDGTDIHQVPSKKVARSLGLLAQSSHAPAGITVYQLVARGRFPHQGLLHQWSYADELAVGRALELCSLAELAERPVTQLSGGQQQRVWIALALAQETDVLLLDEPTTYLDVAHQVEVLDLVRRLNGEGTTVVAVLHDINQAARYADVVVAMRGGAILAQGPPDLVVTSEVMRQVFDLRCRVIEDPETGSPLVIPAAPAPLRRG